MSWIEWLKVARNQKLLRFIGAAVVAVVSTGWAVFHTLSSSDQKPELKSQVPPIAVIVPPASSVLAVINPSVTTESGGIAVGTITGGTVTINGGNKP